MDSSRLIKEYRVKEQFSKFARSFYETIPASDRDIKGGWGRFDVDSKLKQYFLNAGVLNVWYTPIYVPVFAVGDWVINPTAVSPTALRISSIEEDKFYVKDSKHGDNKPYISFDEAYKWRRATEKEIEHTRKIIVIGPATGRQFRVIIHEGHISVGDYKLSIDYVTSLLSMYKPNDYHGLPWHVYLPEYSTIKIACAEVGKKDLEKIQSAYNEVNN